MLSMLFNNQNGLQHQILPRFSKLRLYCQNHSSLLELVRAFVNFALENLVWTLIFLARCDDWSV